MASSFTCSLVTPEAKLVDETVTYARIPAWDGQLGIAPGHAPLLVKLGIGELRLDFPNGASRYFLIEGGFAQMIDDRLTILANRSIPAERLVASDAKAELERALAAVPTTDEDFAQKQAAVQTAREKQRLAQMSRQRGI